MWRIAIALALTIACGITRLAAKKPPPIQWKQGTVTAMTHRTDVVPNERRGLLSSDSKIEINNFVLQGESLIYTVEEVRTTGGGHGLYGVIKDQADKNAGCILIINDPIKYAESDKFLLVVDSKQKQCKLQIVGRERIQKETATQPQ